MQQCFREDFPNLVKITGSGDCYSQIDIFKAALTQGAILRFAALHNPGKVTGTPDIFHHGSHTEITTLTNNSHSDNQHFQQSGNKIIGMNIKGILHGTRDMGHTLTSFLGNSAA